MNCLKTGDPCPCCGQPIRWMMLPETEVNEDA